MAKFKGAAKSPVKVKKNGSGRPRMQDETDECRCKEMSKKTPRELLKVMISDLTFRKKKR